MHQFMRKLLGIYPTYEQAAAQCPLPPSPQLLPDQLYYLQPRERTFFAIRQMTLRIKDSFLTAKYPRFWQWQACLKTMPLAIWSVSMSVMLVLLASGYYDHQNKQAHAVAMANMPLHNAHEQLQTIIAATPIAVPPYDPSAKSSRIMVKPYIAPPREDGSKRAKMASRSRRAAIPPRTTVTTAATTPRQLPERSLNPRPLTPRPQSSNTSESAHTGA